MTRRCISLTSALLLVGYAATSFSAPPQPVAKPELGFVNLRAAGQKANRSDNTIYILDLYCGLSSCELQMTELNDCNRGPDELTPAFTLRTRTWASWAGFLEMTSQSEHEISVVAYQATHRTLPARFTFRYESGANGKSIATHFTATGLVDLRLFPREVKTFDIEPYSSETKTADLNCPMRLRN
jgi:hypothetical protein